MTGVENKNVLITGAGGSVGSGVAQTLLKNECQVGLAYRSSSHENYLKSLEGFNEDRVLLLPSDLNNPKAADNIVRKMKDQFGKIDMLFNAVGGWLGGKKLHEHLLDELQKMLLIDTVPTFNIMKAVLPVMQEQHSGKIVNFISMSIFGKEKNNAIYTASKSAVNALSHAAAQEYSADNIQVFTIAPTTINSESNRQAMPNADYSAWVSIDAIAELAIDLLKDGKYLSGTTFKMSGRV